MVNGTLNLHKSLVHTYEEFMRQFVALVPNLLEAALLLFIGLILAHILRIITKKLVGGFDSLFRRVAKTDGAKQEKMKDSYALITSRIVFWITITFFIAATANLLELKVFSGWMDRIINYLPTFIMGILIILAGILLGNGAKTSIISAANSVNIERIGILGHIIQILVILFAIIIGTSQMGVNVHILSNMLIITTGVLLAGGALAFGLGAKTLIANVIGAQYVRKHCHIGEQMTIGDVKGLILEITQTSIVLDTGEGRAVIPAKEFNEQLTSFSSDSEDTKIS